MASCSLYHFDLPQSLEDKGAGDLKRSLRLLIFMQNTAAERLKTE